MLTQCPMEMRVCGCLSRVRSLGSPPRRRTIPSGSKPGAATDRHVILGALTFRYAAILLGEIRRGDGLERAGHDVLADLGDQLAAAGGAARQQFAEGALRAFAHVPIGVLAKHERVRRRRANISRHHERVLSGIARIAQVAAPPGKPQLDLEWLSAAATP